jgi:hypothetical protein
VTIRFETPSSFLARDELDQAAGALTGKTLPIGGTWAGAGDADDFSVETAGHTAQRTAVSDSSAFSGARYAVAGTATYASVVVQIDMKVSAAPIGLYGGVIARYIDSQTWMRVGWFPETGDLSYELVSAGSVLGNKTTSGVLTAGTGTWVTLRLLADPAGRFWIWLFRTGSASGSWAVCGQSSALATGGALASGKTGFWDTNPTATASTRNYNDFLVFAPTPDAAIFA